MKKLCTRGGVNGACSVAVRSRSALAAPAPVNRAEALKKFAKRAAYLVFAVAVPGSMLMLAAWHWRDVTHWLADRMRGFASAP